MRKQWIAVAAAVIGVSIGAFGVAAQGPGPQGAGGGEAKESSKTSHSHNPIKWIKKDSNKADEKAKEANVKKSSATQATNAKATKSSAKQQAINDDPTPRARRSLNPIHWIKKDRNKTTDKQQKTNNKKSSEKPVTLEAPARPAEA